MCGDVIRALDGLIVLPAPDELFAHHYPEFDYCVGPAVRAA